jgi:hypothetical protein
LRDIKVVRYSSENLADELSNSYTLPIAIKRKNHFIYFSDYLGKDGINAKTIVAEENYISKDFLSDYSLYYSLCFEKIPKTCKRLHFFNSEFNKEDFLKELLDNSPDSPLWQSYLGFLVVKPLPYTIIGTTVLEQYPNNEKYKRFFFGTRDYHIHLFGKELVVNSLAFQEQDTIISACATTAIWSTLHKASIDFNTILKSPSEITQDAGIMSIDGSRLFPNKGLDVFQMCQSLERSGLVSEVRVHDETTRSMKNDYVKSLILAYSQIGIPIILIVYVPARTYGLHALAVSGYRFGDNQLQYKNKKGPVLRSNIMEKIYVHDDQWGPFSRVEFDINDTIKTNWSRFHPSGKNPPTFKHVIIPLYPKVRISYDDILGIVHGIDVILEKAFTEIPEIMFNWEVKLYYTNKFLEEMLHSSNDNDLKKEIVLSHYPKYIWRASCYIHDSKVLDFIFDATDLAKNMFCIKVVSYDIDIQAILYDFLIKNPDSNQFFNHPSCEKYIDYFVRVLKI